MPIVLADVDVLGMEETLSLLAHASDVDELADVTYRTFGECAGVAAAGPAWMATLDDWTWTIGVNLMECRAWYQSFYSAHDRARSRMSRCQHGVSGRPYRFSNRRSVAVYQCLLGYRWVQQVACSFRRNFRLKFR
jgi:hypothetical protein